MNEQTSYTIDDLSESVGIPVRTIRFYVSEGLLPGPGSRGKAATYSEEHRSRLRLIRRLVEERVPLAEIRERLASLTMADVQGLLVAEERRTATLEHAAQRSPKDYVAALLEGARARRQPPTSSPGAEPTPLTLRLAAPPVMPPSRQRGEVAADVWRRIPLGPGIELHVRGDIERGEAGRIERIIEAARAAEFGQGEERKLDIDESRQE